MTRTATPPFILLFLSLCLLGMFAAAFQSFLPTAGPTAGSQRGTATRDAAPPPMELSTPAEGDAAPALTEQQADDLSELMRRIQANPQDGEALAEIGEAFLSTKDWARADAFLSRAISAAPADTRPRYLMGISLYQQGRMAEAAGVFEKLLDIKKDAAAQYNLAIIYKYHLDKITDARTLLRDIVDSGTADAATVEWAKKELE